MNEHETPRLTRRELLLASAGLAGAALLGSEHELAGAPLREGRYGSFRMGLQSYSLRTFKTDDALKKTRKLGLKYWEAYPGHIPQMDDKDQCDTLLAQLKEAEIKLIAWGVVGFDKDEAKAEKTFAFAKAMGLETISADPTPEAFPILDKLVEEYKINIAIHNHGPGARYNKIASVYEAVREHHPRIGACVDTGHFLRSGEDPVEAVKLLGKRVFGVHLKDVKGGRTFTEIGQGDLDTPKLLRTLREMKFKGLLSLEYEEHASDPILYIDQCLAATRDAIEKSKR